MSKKQIIILISIFLLAAVAFGVYYFYFKPRLAEQVEENTTPTVQNNISDNAIVNTDEKLIKLSKDSAVSPVLNADGKTIKYIGKSGDIYEIEFNGQNQKETKFTTLKELIKTLWSPSRSGLIAIYGEAGGRKMFYYDIPNKKTAPFNQNIKQVAFSKEENKIAYHYFDSSRQESSIMISDPGGENAKVVFRSRLRELRLDWINKNEVAISSVPSGLAENMLWILNIDTQQLQTVLANVNGLTSKWNDSGEKLIFSKTDSKGENLALSLANKNGTAITDLNIATLPEKCVFVKDGQNLICAVPAIVPEITWPDDYYKKIYSAREQIWKINLSANKKEQLYEFQSDQIDATDLIISPGQDYLVFLNRADDNIYSLKLK